MATCAVRWRSSGGRGEFEYVPADSIADRDIDVFFEPLGVTIPAEVRALRVQGKPRLRKFHGNDRSKLHLPQLVMAVARLPEPGREDLAHSVTFPLRNKSFVMDSMEFDIFDDDGLTVTLAPLGVSIRNAAYRIELQDRLVALASDFASVAEIASKHPDLATAVKTHADAVLAGINSAGIRLAADKVNELQGTIFGQTNAGSVTTLEEADAKPTTDLEEDIVGKEGRLLTRIHAYKERDRGFVKRAKDHYRKKNSGKLICEACGLDPIAKYGPDGERCIEAHHKVPIEELQPDSITPVSEMAMVCASCHKIIHSKKPCLLVSEVMGQKP